jgi:hypothetical protein
MFAARNMMFASQSTAARYRAAVMADSPVAYWRLGETSGTTAADEKGSYPGIYVGSPTLGVVGAFGGNFAASFNDISQHVDLGATFRDALSTHTIGTVEAWVNPSSIGSSQTIFSSSGSSVPWYKFMIRVASSGVIIIDIRSDFGNNVFWGNTVLIAGAWTHVVLIGNGGGNNYSLYVNGVLQTLTSSPMSYVGAWFQLVNNRNTAQLARHIESNTLQRPFNGSIDEFAVYNTALSAARIAAHYAAAGY